jgi:universal stress protein F
MNKILVALDGSPRERRILAAAAGLARKMGARLVLFRAIGIPRGLPVAALAMAPNEIEQLLEKEAKSGLDELAGSVPGGLVEKTVVHVGSPWDAICTAAIAEDVDAIVLGSHGYDVLDRLTGTTAAKVVNHADRTVIVIRAPERLE